MYSCILGGIQYINTPMGTPAKSSAFNFQLIIQLQCTCTTDPKGMIYIVYNNNTFVVVFCGWFLGIHVPEELIL